MKLTSLVLLAVVAVACTDGGPTGGTAPGTEPEAASPADGSDADTDDLEWVSPVSEVLGAAMDFDDAELRGNQAAIDDLTIACMAAEGFDYHPTSPERELWHARSELSPHEFAATYGFGHTTIDVAAASTSGGGDPNTAMLAEMSPAEREAWHTALWGGPDVPAVGEPEETFEPPEPSGCAHEAMAEVYGHDDAAAAAEAEAIDAFAPLLTELNSLYDQVQRDPRMVAAGEAYSACMADAGQPGYSWDGDGDDGGAPSPRSAVSQRVRAALDAAASSSTVEGAGSEETFDGAGELSSLAPDVLAELRAFEIELAVADAACRVEYESTYREVTFEHESRWVEANRAELEAYRAAANPEGGR